MSDLPETGSGKQTATDLVAGYAADLVRTLHIYSRLPTGQAMHRPPALDRLALVLPVASLVIGAIPALVVMLAAVLGLPPLLGASLALGVWLLLSGARAEDALARAVDGLVGGDTPERRLDIMDERTRGTHGTAALALGLLARGAALAALVAIHPITGALCWLAAILVSHSASLWPMVQLPAARADREAAGAGRMNLQAFIIGMALAAVLAVLCAAPVMGGMRVLLALALGGALVTGWTMLCRRLAGGQTQVLIGALQALIEIAVLGALLVA